MNILIVTGGSISLAFAGEWLKKHIFDRIIAADSGLAACQALNLKPTDILGDFDSLKNLELREIYRSQGVPVREFPTRKDYTDTHLAISYAIDLWNEDIENEDSAPDMHEKGVWLLGATGTRLDHTMANIGMLVNMAEHNIPCRIVDEHNILEVLKGPARANYRRPEKREFFSLLALSPTVKGLDMIGFSYPLENAELPAFVSLGVSNEITDEYGEVRLKEGYLLVDQSRD